MQFKAIVPRRDSLPKIDIQKTMTFMRQFAQEALGNLKEYPPKPSRSRYKRTGDLSRGWHLNPKTQMQGGDIIVGFENKEDYWVWVQGRRRSRPGQLPRFQRYGWYSMTQVNTEIWPRYRAKLLGSLGLRSSSIGR